MASVNPPNPRPVAAGSFDVIMAVRTRLSVMGLSLAAMNAPRRQANALASGDPQFSKLRLRLPKLRVQPRALSQETKACHARSMNTVVRLGASRRSASSWFKYAWRRCGHVRRRWLNSPNNCFSTSLNDISVCQPPANTTGDLEPGTNGLYLCQR